MAGTKEDMSKLFSFSFAPPSRECPWQNQIESDNDNGRETQQLYFWLYTQQKGVHMCAECVYKNVHSSISYKSRRVETPTV